MAASRRARLRDRLEWRRAAHEARPAERSGETSAGDSTRQSRSHEIIMRSEQTNDKLSISPVVLSRSPPKHSLLSPRGANAIISRDPAPRSERDKIQRPLGSGRPRTCRTGDAHDAHDAADGNKSRARPILGDDGKRAVDHSMAERENTDRIPRRARPLPWQPGVPQRAAISQITGAPPKGSSLLLRRDYPDGGACRPPFLRQWKSR